VSTATAKRSIINTTTRSDQTKQSIATPWAFIHALEQRFGTPVDFDLAASESNAKARRFWTQEDNALQRDWSRLGPRLAFLNPPFANIKPWALGPQGKAHNPAAGMLACRWLPRWTVMLVPSSHSTDWFLELRGKVQIDAIPRIQFEGATHLYPKDLCLVVAGFGVTGSGYWDWRVSYRQWCRDNDVTPEPEHMRGLLRTPPVNVLPDLHWSRDPFAEGAP
jgi:phage N-6-adenine-methyltransferase